MDFRNFFSFSTATSKKRPYKQVKAPRQVLKDKVKVVSESFPGNKTHKGNADERSQGRREKEVDDTRGSDQISLEKQPALLLEGVNQCFLLQTEYRKRTGITTASR